MEVSSNVEWAMACELFFHVKPYSYELDILNAVFTKKAKKITIRATTRAGKSYTLAEIAILKAVLEDDCRVGIIAPSFDKTRIIMDYVASFLAGNQIFDDIVMIEVSSLSKLERLRKEVSKRRITFKNGSAIECKSVDLDSKGFGVMGYAYDCIIVDETDLIDDSSYNKIYRMLVENPDAQIIEIGNPWFLAHFYEHHHDNAWEKIHIRWQDCVAAGRMTLEAVEDQRKEITALEFKVLFDADFPDEIEHAVFQKEAIEAMTAPGSAIRHERILIGVDVARGGRDKTVLTVFGIEGNKAYYLRNEVLDTNDTMKIVGAVIAMADLCRTPRVKVEIAVDTVGLGAGVFDRLLELGYEASAFIAGGKAMNSERFYNLKTEVAFRTAEIANESLILNIPRDSRYVLETRSITFEVCSDKQRKVVDPKDKSPDFFDSMIIALSRFVYHEEAFISSSDDERKPEWMRRRPKDLLKPRD